MYSDRVDRNRPPTVAVEKHYEMGLELYRAYAFWKQAGGRAAFGYTRGKGDRPPTHPQIRHSQLCH